MLRLVFLVHKEDAGQVNHIAGDVDRLQGVDERLVEVLDIFVVRRANNGAAKRSLATLGVVMIGF